MTIRGWLMVLPAVFAIGCAAEPSGSKEEAPPPPESNVIGTGDLREASPEDDSAPAAQASAKSRDEVIDQARADQLVGEEVSGYLALVDDQDLIAGKNAPSDLDARVQDINRQRRALYTDLAAKDGVTVETVAQTTACALLREKVKVGEAYRTEASKWKVRTFDVPVSTPSFCTAP
jgi:uncharacterized protein YdbL (DUF1318 family)